MENTQIEDFGLHKVCKLSRISSDNTIASIRKIGGKVKIYAIF